VLTKNKKKKKNKKQKTKKKKPPSPHIAVLPDASNPYRATAQARSV